MWESVVCLAEKTDCHDQFENWSRNDRCFLQCTLFIFFSAAAYTFPERKVTALANDPTAKSAARAHALHLDNREKLSLAGVEDVSGFDENLILLVTSLGALTVRGEQLHIERIDLDAGQLELRGKIRELSYEEPAAASFWARLFG